MTPARFDQLPKHERRRLVGWAVARVTGITVVLFALYYVMPIDNRSETSAVLMLGVGMAVFCVVLGWQVRQILQADYPQLRAVESAGTAVPLLIIVFAFVYLNLAASDPATFTQPLTRSASLYFTITVLSTVGFGDITPVGDTTRLIVSLQMMLDLVLIGFILRLLTGAVRTGLQRQQAATPDAPVGAPAAAASDVPLVDIARAGDSPLAPGLIDLVGTDATPPDPSPGTAPDGPPA